MMLYVVHLSAEPFAGKGALELLIRPRPFALIAEPIQDERKIGTPGKKIAHLLPEIGLRVLIDRDMLDFGETDTRFTQAIANGLGGETCPVFHAPIALLLGSSDQCPIAQHACRSIAVIGVDTKNNHPGVHQSWILESALVRQKITAEGDAAAVTAGCLARCFMTNCSCLGRCTEPSGTSAVPGAPFDGSFPQIFLYAFTARLHPSENFPGTSANTSSSRGRMKY